MPTFAEIAAAARARAAGTAPAAPAPLPVDMPETSEDLGPVTRARTAPAPIPALVIPPPAVRPGAPTRDELTTPEYIAPTPTTAPVQEPIPPVVAQAPATQSAPPTAPVGDLSTRALLVDLQVKCWTGTKTDKTVTHQVAVKHNAGGRAGRYVKNLIPRLLH